jgi:hypothetical protein
MIRGFPEARGPSPKEGRYPLWSRMKRYRYQADLFRLQIKHRVRPSGYGHQEFQPLADNMYEGERPDCYK